MAAKKQGKIFSSSWEKHMTPPTKDVRSPFGSFDELERGVKANNYYNAPKRRR